MEDTHRPGMSLTAEVFNPFNLNGGDVLHHGSLDSCSTLVAMASSSDGLQPTRDGLQPIRAFFKVSNLLPMSRSAYVLGLQPKNMWGSPYACFWRGTLTLDRFCCPMRFTSQQPQHGDVHPSWFWNNQPTYAEVEIRLLEF